MAYYNKYKQKDISSLILKTEGKEDIVEAEWERKNLSAIKLKRKIHKRRKHTEDEYNKMVKVMGKYNELKL